MKIASLYIKNFLMIGEVECSLAEKGLVLIQGVNHDDTSQNSNGSGKSSFADAIAWGLYGVTARGETGDSVVNRTAGSGCQVDIELDDGTERYLVSRYRKHPKFKNQLRVSKLDGSTELDISKGTDRETQKVVDRIMGCSEEVFNAAIYAGQERMVDLPGMTDKQLKTLVEEAAGIDRLQLAHARALSDHRDAKSKFELEVRTFETLELNARTREEEIVAAKDEFAQWETNRKQRLAEAIKQAREVQLEYQEAQKHVPEAESKLKALEVSEKNINDKLAKLSEEKTEETRLQGEVAKASKAKATLVYEANRLAEEAKRLNARAKESEDLIGKPCGECGKPYAKEDLHDACRIAKEKVAETVAKYKAAAAQAKEADEKLSISSDALKKYQDQMTDPSQEIAALEEISEEKTKQKAVLTAATDLSEEMREIANDAKTIKSEVNPYIETVRRLTESLEKAKERMNESKLARETAQKAIRMAEATIKVFGPGGVRAHILDTVTPFLNARTADYLSVLTDGNISAVWNTLSLTAKGEVREKFVIQVESKVGASSFGGLSGGEKRKVRLACSMALQDLVSSRATKPIDLYIADEIDHALDDSGLERLMTILDEKARTKGTALVISHNSLSDWIRQSVTMIKKGGYATLDGDALS